MSYNPGIYFSSNRFKYKGDNTEQTPRIYSIEWWLRSPSIDVSNWFCMCDRNTSMNRNDAGHGFGVYLSSNRLKMKLKSEYTNEWWTRSQSSDINGQYVAVDDNHPDCYIEWVTFGHGV